MKPLIACATACVFVKLMQGKEKGLHAKGIPQTEATHEMILDASAGAFATERGESYPSSI